MLSGCHTSHIQTIAEIKYIKYIHPETICLAWKLYLQHQTLLSETKTIQHPFVQCVFGLGKSLVDVIPYTTLNIIRTKWMKSEMKELNGLCEMSPLSHGIT